MQDESNNREQEQPTTGCPAASCDLPELNSPPSFRLCASTQTAQRTSTSQKNKYMYPHLQTAVLHTVFPIPVVGPSMTPSNELEPTHTMSTTGLEVSLVNGPRSVVHCPHAAPLARQVVALVP